MRKAGWLNLILIGLIVGLASGSHPEETKNLSQAIQQQQPSISYQVTSRSHSNIHTITIPHNGTYFVTPAVASKLTPINDLAADRAIAAINGGYFDPKNQKTTSYITQQANLVADPRTNERLIDNPDLQPYLGKILNRAEFRRYLCGQKIRYDISLHGDSPPSHCKLLDALGGGPQLLPEDTSVAEGFIAYSDGKIIRDAIGSNSPNARSAVGITCKGDIILAMVAQIPASGRTSGMSLPELTEFLSSLGVVKAMNLDGGSSSSLFYRGKTFYGKIDSEGNKIKRPIKSVLLVRVGLF